MPVMEVYVPEKKDKFGNLLNIAGTGMNIYGAGKGFGWWGNGASTVAPEATGGGFTAPQAAPSATQPATTYAGSESAAPLTSGGGGESMMAMAGPIAVGVAGMGLGAKSELDYATKGEKSGNAKYSSRGSGPALRTDPKSWGGDSISRRLSAKNMDAMNPFNFTELRKTIEIMPIDQVDKSSLLGKLSQLSNLSRMFKTG